MKIFKNNVVKLVAIAVVVFGVIFGVVSLTQNWGKKRDTIDTEASMKKLDSLYSKLNVNKLNPKQDPDFQGNDENAEKLAVLPDISEYPFIVNPTTDDFLTLYSSIEKTDWLIDVANKFNQSNPTVDGKPISVGVRAVSSSLGADFIASGKYTPDVFIPSGKIYGDMLISQGVKAVLLEERVTGNVSGIVISKKKSDELAKKYGNMDVNAAISAVLDGQLALGYTTPLSNEDGFNFLLSLLANFDGSNPLSDASIAQLRKFQDKIPLISYDNDQLNASLTGGTLDAIVTNYKAYWSSPNLKSSYEFVPIGSRQDSPVYEIGDLTDIKKQITAKFIEFCKSEDSQKSATDKGFNALNEYSQAASPLSGTDILQAQEIYKKERNGSSDLTAVFVADISGSMEGSPLLNLKASLSRAAGVVDSNANIGLITFSDYVNIAVPIAKFDNAQRSYFSGAVKSMTAGGGTAMFDAVVVAQKMLMDAKAQNPNTKLLLFVLTDGDTNRGYGFDDIENITSGLRIPIYTIGYNYDEGLDVLQKLSNINEAASMNADSDNIIYRIESLFNSQF